MKALHIDFAPRGAARALAALSPRSLMLTAIGSALLGGGIFAAQEIAERQDRSLGELQRRQAEQIVRRAPAAAPQRETRISEEQASGVNSAVQRLNLPWSDLLNAMERGTPPGIALLELEPDPRRNLLRGVAEAKSPASMIDYMRRLKQEKFFSDVRLTRHAVTDEPVNRVGAAPGGQEPVKPLRFEFEAEWSPLGL